MNKNTVKKAWDCTKAALPSVAGGLFVGMVMGIGLSEPTKSTYIAWGCAVVGLPIFIFIVTLICHVLMERKS